MADLDRKELIRVFLQEAADWIDALDRWLLEMEDEPGATEPVTQFMRSAHTLKGSAGIVGLSAVVEAVTSTAAPVYRANGRQYKRAGRIDLLDLVSTCEGSR